MEDKVIDTDSHVTEPADLWTSRMARKFLEDAPRLAVDETGVLRWKVQDHWSTSVGFYSQAGWPEFYPSTPGSYEEMDKAAYDPVSRLQRLDEYGIFAQVLYPNLIGFEAGVFAGFERDFSLACVQAYNDFLIDWSSVDTNRLVPIAMLPLWDVEASVREVHRAVDLGHRGVLFGGHMERIGLPPVWDEAYDPIWRAVVERGVPVNFHAGFSEKDKDAAAARAVRDRNFQFVQFVKNASIGFANNMSTIADLILGGVCDRFPELNLVSVESGFGYLPYLLEALDWQWLNTGGRQVYPGRMLPSEYFRRQIYACFWFERTTLSLLPDYAGNVMFETDFPHPTSLSPGQASIALSARETIARNLADVRPDVRRRVLQDNAAALYGVTV